MLRRITNILLLIAILNSTSFIFARVFFRSRELDVYRAASPGERMNYLLAGSFDQPDTAFAFLLDYLEGGITFVKYPSMGWNAGRTADLIEADITKNQYQARLYTISIGDKVGRILDSRMTGLKIVAINPCVGRYFLHDNLKPVMEFCVPLVEGVAHVLGWISRIPFLSSPAGWYSPITALDQFMEIRSTDAPKATSQTIGVIISTEDEFLEESAVREYFGEEMYYVTINTAHSRTAAEPEAYLKAVLEIEANDAGK